MKNVCKENILMQTVFYTILKKMNVLNVSMGIIGIKKIKCAKILSLFVT